MRHRLLTLGPDNELMWGQPYVYPAGAQWHSVVTDGVPPPGPDEVKGIGSYADTPHEAERLAKAYRTTEHAARDTR